MSDICECGGSTDCEVCGSCWICIDDGMGCEECSPNESEKEYEEYERVNGPYGDPNEHGAYCGCPACK